ncbi:MAG: hypothetical protein JO053_15135 [Acidobacteria bacterium]|nr:hypothetical protein [Acidobacteriota bacterium]
MAIDDVISRKVAITVVVFLFVSAFAAEMHAQSLPQITLGTAKVALPVGASPCGLPSGTSHWDEYSLNAQLTTRPF